MSQDEGPLKVGIIGTGFGSVVQFPGFSQHPRFDPIAIAGKHETKTKKVADKLELDYYYTDWKELITNDEIDMISIVTPPNLHHPMTLAALEEGKHVLCEKPLSTNLDNALEMQEQAVDSGLITMIDLVFRYIPSRAYMIELIKNGYIGDIYQFDITVRNSSRLNPRTRGYNWWSSKREGGGVLNALGSHYIDFMLQIFDNIERVSGQTAIHIPKRLNKMTGRMKTVSSDDAFVSMFDVGNDCLASMNISTTLPFGRGPKIEAYGSEGSLIMLEDQSLIGGKVGEHESFQPIEIPENLQLDLKEETNHLLVPPFIRLLDEFDKSLSAGRSLHPNFDDGVRVQRIIDAIRRSDKQNKWIEIDF